MDINFFKKDLIIVNNKLKTKNDCLKYFSQTLEEKGYGKSSKKIIEKSIR